MYRKILRAVKNPALAFGKIRQRIGKRIAARRASPLSELAAARQTLMLLRRVALNNFLDTGATLTFPRVENCAVSVLLVLHNRAELTLECLASLARQTDALPALELVIVDNASTDETARLLERIGGATIIRNPSNSHFLAAANQAARAARGAALLFLNNDAQLLDNAVSAALATLHSAPDIGAVGAKLILPDGTLQEAGGILWQDGMSSGYGRGDAPTSDAYNFRRDTDFCSGAFLLTPRATFDALGGFDAAFAPAYYEDVDYCLRLRRAGLRVVYEPRAAVLHYEHGSAESDRAVRDLLQLNRATLLTKHSEILRAHYPRQAQNLLRARAVRRNSNARRILFIEETVPHVSGGAGFPRSNQILRALVAAGHEVTVLTTQPQTESWAEIYRDLPPEIEILREHTRRDLRKILRDRADFYETLIVSRPNNLTEIQRLLRDDKNLLGKAKLIYDSEAIAAPRDSAYRRLIGTPLSDAEERAKLAAEMELARGSDCILAVSPQEARIFSAAVGGVPVHLLSHSMTARPSPRSFSERSDFLFVGNLLFAEWPNFDSIMWFVREVFPRVRARLPRARLRIVGATALPEILALATQDGIEVLGAVEDLTPIYDTARVFIAPTRFAAGIPGKVGEAAAHGVPVVATELLTAQLEWQHATELLAARAEAEDFAACCVRLYEDATLWQHIRDNALKRVRDEYSPVAFAAQLNRIVEEVCNGNG